MDRPTSVMDGAADSQVLNTGATFVAENYSGAPLVLNGVSFTGVSSGSQTTVASGIGGGFSVFYLGSNATMDSLLNPAFVDSDSGSPGYALQLNGLTLGKQYSIQISGGDERIGQANTIEVEDGNGDFSFKWDFPGLQDDGSFIEGTFQPTADLNRSRSDVTRRRTPSAEPSWQASRFGTCPSPLRFPPD